MTKPQPTPVPPLTDNEIIRLRKFLSEYIDRKGK